MIDFTPLARKSFEHRSKAVLAAATHLEREQRSQLEWLITRGERSQYGQEHGFSGIKSYEQYAKQVPVKGYEHFRPYAMRMVQGERDVLWPGRVRRFAQSSGTSGGKSKYVPVTHDALKRNHYAGAGTSVALYIASNPKSKLFSGKGLILGGSFANELSLPSSVKVGDLSAHLIECINPAVNLFRTPQKHIALMENWEEKLPALVHAASHANVTNISGVPSWLLVLLKQVLAYTGKPTLAEVWPSIEVFFHGGIAFEPYRQEYAEIMPPSMRYLETYNASEGFFASQIAPDDPGMLLIPDIGVFYEFVPIGQEGKDFPEALPAWAVEPGATYSLVISACNGLWRYAIGDTVTIVSVSPLRISIAGRTKSYINAFGEELMVHNADAAIAKACEKLDCSIANYTAAPVYTLHGHKGRHQWLIEWSVPPKDLAEFEATLDAMLQQENSDYQAKRKGDIFLGQLTVVNARPGLFDEWLASTGKLGGQRKVPRLSNDRHIIDKLLAIN